MSITRLKSRPPGTVGFVADGFSHHTENNAFRARVRMARNAVSAEFDMKLAAADHWTQRLRLRWQKHQELQRVTRALYPSRSACFLRVVE